jgi:uncharacterized membrane protein
MRLKRRICWLVLAAALAEILLPYASLAQAEKTDLTLNIVYDNFRSLKAGEQRTVFLEVGNYGKKELTNIRLTADSPEGWTVEFAPQVIDSLATDSFQTVTITLKPPENTTKGGYNIAIIAESGAIRRVTSVYVQVESGSLFWAWVGIGLAALVIAGAVAIFLRFGKEEK